MENNLKVKLRRKNAKNEEKTLNRKIKTLFLWKRSKNMILNLEIKNYRSFKDVCSFTTEPTSSKAKVDNICEVETNAEGLKKALKISLIYGANASGKTNIISFYTGSDDGSTILTTGLVMIFHCISRSNLTILRLMHR